MALEVTSSLIFFVLFIVFFIVGIAYALMLLKKRANEKIMRMNESNVEDNAYNQIHIVRSMARVMKDRGYKVEPVESMLSKAERAYESQRYLESLEIANNAKRILLRMKEENLLEDGTSPQVERELEIIKKIEREPKQDEMPPQVKDFVKKLPPNYLQSKFEIGVVEEKILGMEDGQLKEYAKLYVQRAKRAFDLGDYNEALRLAVKGNRIIDTGEIEPGLEKPQVERAQKVDLKVEPLIKEEPKKSEELHCPNCGAIVQPEDRYCWNCGAKLVFIYTCPNCGAEVSSEDKFCRQCGYRLR
ncbi:putative amidophosphoribosyltransferase [Aciduliprofundum sp. MAR08-339]|uniref:zinc ribbon domain-containing protein n=1 Tax=Aciduliprofundum sp. (strain MAR08-339) TaxID=673860 RepID=UPI0002A4CA9D|nr:putative amidophosphoribosyltransferase [Aciduliprofundum sp. MAR08-339]